MAAAPSSSSDESKFINVYYDLYHQALDFWLGSAHIGFGSIKDSPGERPEELETFVLFERGAGDEVSLKARVIKARNLPIVIQIYNLLLSGEEPTFYNLRPKIQISDFQISEDSCPQLRPIYNDLIKRNWGVDFSAKTEIKTPLHPRVYLLYLWSLSERVSLQFSGGTQFDALESIYKRLSSCLIPPAT